MTGKVASLRKSVRIGIHTLNQAGRVRHGSSTSSRVRKGGIGVVWKVCCGVVLVGSHCTFGERHGKCRAYSSIGLTGRREGVLAFLLVVLTSSCSRQAPVHDRSRTNTARSRKTKGRARERCRIDGRHPDASFVDFEKVCDERVEVDV